MRLLWRQLLQIHDAEQGLLPGRWVNDLRISSYQLDEGGTQRFVPHYQAFQRLTEPGDTERRLDYDLSGYHEIRIWVNALALEPVFLKIPTWAPLSHCPASLRPSPNGPSITRALTLST